MKTVVFSGSFKPMHEGHFDVIHKALTMFDKVIICHGVNPDKPTTDIVHEYVPEWIIKHGRIERTSYKGLMADFIKDLRAKGEPVVAMIRGIRNAQDLEYERTTQYHNEDLGIGIPTIYLIADRNHVHISSSAIRIIEKLRKK